MPLLTDDYLSTYPNQPQHMNELGQFVFYRTYSRWLPDKNRRETWKETCARAVQYNVSLVREQYAKIGVMIPEEWLIKEAESLFDSQFNLNQFLSGRTNWVGGAEGGVAEKFPLANFNCSFTNIHTWDDMADLFYLLLVGTGVGFKCTKDMARNLQPLRNNIKVEHSEYHPLPKKQRIEKTEVTVHGNGFAKIFVGDSKEGWVEALRQFLNFHWNPHLEFVHTVKISYNSVRPHGERLLTFGGTASGPEPLKEMFQGFADVIANRIDEHLAPMESVSVFDQYNVKHLHPIYVHPRPIHILDMGNLIGNNVVVGGVRRTAEIFLCDADDWECILAKYGINGIWDEAQHRNVIAAMRSANVEVPEWMINITYQDANARPLHHRRMSNNSIAFKVKPSREMLSLVFTIMEGEGEPGFVNLRELAMRRFKGMGINEPTSAMLEEMMDEIGMNPCAEIDLRGKGVCNLTTVNVKRFVSEDRLIDMVGLMEAQRLSARAGLRMTLVTLELPDWDKIQHQDNLLGCSLTGWKDAMALICADEKMEADILHVLRVTARNEADRYAKELRVNAPLLVTTVKPEGTLSQVAGGVSSGLHWSHSPFYIRRIRINASDPLAKAVRYLGWRVNPETGTPGATREEQMLNARTLVIDFPVASGAGITKDDVSALQQMDTYFRFQQHYSEHNSSNTIHVRKEEWTVMEETVFEKWDDFTAVSFLSHDGHSYQLAPYEQITEAEFWRRDAEMSPFDIHVLQAFETGILGDVDVESCETGVCPVR